jgi:hypothetical protein
VASIAAIVVAWAGVSVRSTVSNLMTARTHSGPIIQSVGRDVNIDTGPGKVNDTRSN